MITHSEAEALISARMDQQLDPIAERALSAHLATCAGCRAFAQSNEALAMGLRGLPYLPASSTVSRRVMARIDEGRSPWARLGAFLNTNPGPALSTFAVIAVLFLLGFFVLNHFILDDGGGPNQGGKQLAAQPTAPPTQSAEFTLTETAEAIEEVVATEEPTGTTAPEEKAPDAPTATESAATEQPDPTVKEEPEPTAAPTEIATELATEEPSSLRTASGGKITPVDIVDLTSPDDVSSPAATATPYEDPTATTEPEPAATSTPEPTAAEEPTATANPTETEEPTATATPTATDEPTATSTAEPTATEEPTATATAEPTATQAPTATATSTEETAPPILPIDGAEVIEAPEDAEATGTSVAGTKQAPEPLSTARVTEPDAAIESINETSTADSGDGTGGQTIEPAGAAKAASTPGDDTGIQSVESETPATSEQMATEAPTDEDVLDLASNSEAYGDIAGERGGRLILDGGRMEYGAQAHPVSMVSVAGLEVQTVQGENGQVIAVCAPGGECTDLTSASTEGPANDDPLGWLDSGLVYVRNEDDTITYRYLVPNESASEVVSDEALLSGGGDIAPVPPVYQAEGRIWVVTTGGDWLSLTPGGGQQLPNGYSAPQSLRFATTGNRGLLVGYVSSGQLIIASGDQPGSPILALPFSGPDFDIAPSGDQLVISTGNAIEFYGLDGTLLSTYASDNVQTGSVLWLNSGIVYVDTATGVLMQIPNP